MNKITGISIGLGAVAVGAAAFLTQKGLAEHRYRKVYPKRYTMEQEKFTDKNADRIHFLNTGWSDAILIESKGKFALVDCGEDSDNPRNLPALEFEGQEEKILAYLKKHAVNSEGKVELEFIVGTHAHSDHLGGFDTLLNDDDVIVKKAFLKPYDASRISDYEIREWDNQEVYDQTVNALNARGVEIVSDISDEFFDFGNFRCRFYNTAIYKGNKKRGENENSLALHLTCKGKTALLAGDVNNIDGAEMEIANQIGKVDLLKFGHHGNPESTTTEFVCKTMPDIGILTSNVYGLHKQAKKDITNISKTSVYATMNENGIIATFTDNGIVLTNHIQDNLN